MCTTKTLTGLFLKTMLCENLNVNPPLKNSGDIGEANEHLNSSIYNANIEKWQKVEAKIKENVNWEKVGKILDILILSIHWSIHWLSKDLKYNLCRIENMEMINYLQVLIAIEATDCSLWKATKRYCQPNFALKKTSSRENWCWKSKCLWLS